MSVTSSKKITRLLGSRILIIIVFLLVNSTVSILTINFINQEYETFVTEDMELLSSSNVIHISLLEARKAEKEYFVTANQSKIGLISSKTLTITTLVNNINKVTKDYSTSCSVILSNTAFYKSIVFNLVKKLESRGLNAFYSENSTVAKLLTSLENIELTVEQEYENGTITTTNYLSLLKNIRMINLIQNEQFLEIVDVNGTEKEDNLSINIGEIKNLINESSIEQGKKSDLDSLLDTYYNSFLSFSTISSQITQDLDKIEFYSSEIEIYSDSLNIEINERVLNAKASLNQVISVTFLIIIVLTTVTVVTGLTVMIITVRRVISPLGKFETKIQEISSGKLSTEEAEESYVGELSLFDESLSRMNNNLVKMIKSIQNSSTMSITSVEQLIDSLELIDNSAVEITSSTQQISQSSTTQANLSSKAINEVEIISSSIAKNLENIEKTLGVINDIAEQTNILALNAAIEAARAGEYGRGFAVVADNVRRLAEETKLNAMTINQLSEDIRKNEHQVQELKDTFQNFASQSEEFSAISEEVAASTEEQTASIAEVISLSRSLNEQAKKLKESILKFEIIDIQKKEIIE